MPKNNKELSLSQYDQLVDSCADGCENRYCFFKTLLHEIHSSPRVLCQIKCLEILKFEKSEKAGKDIGWGQAGETWVKDGYAAAFFEVYDAEKTLRQNYKATLDYLKECPPKEA